MECESLESEMTEVQDFQCESPEADGQDDEDEVEELQNSLREVVQDPSVKPKLQCLMVDPSFSMVTVQSEDSGIVWETASSRCSTPWASETSSISEAYSMEGSGAQGKITIVFDEEKVIRRRTRSGGRSSRLSDRLRRPGSSRSASALGVERPEMAEVSIPNVKSEKTDAGPDLEEIKDKDQQLFSLISEGYEILNIRVPSKLPTVDEEESTELQDNLSYLDQTPRIKSRNHHGRSQSQGDDISSAADLEILEPKEDSAQAVSSTENKYVDTLKESACDIDYLEKYTLVDVVGLGAQAPAIQDEMNPPVAKPQAEMQKPGTETTTGSPCTSDDSFVFVTDVEISGEHLDDVFYGNVVHEALDDALHRRDEAELKSGEKMRVRRESQRSVKDNGSALFTSEETVLTPIFLSPGPPKIIDQILLEEPTAMSFMYSDLYEDAMGERRKSDEECSEAGSVASERPFRRRLSESEEADGYLEKFTLKDETPAVEVHADSDEDKKEGRMMWLQRTFDMSGCLTRVKEDVEEGKTKKEEAHEEDEANIDGCQSSTDYEKEEEQVVATAKAVIEREASAVFEDQAAPIRKRLEEPVHVSKAEEEKTESPELSVDVKRVQTEPDGSSGNNAVALPNGEELELERISADLRDEQSANESVTETQLPSQKPKVKDKTTDVVEEITDDASKSAVVPELVIKPDIQSDIKAEEQVPAEVVHDEDEPQGETGDMKEVCEEAAFVPELVDVVQKADKVNKVTEAKAEATTKVTETETKNQVIVGSIESVEKETPDEMKDLEAAAAKAADPAEMLSDNESVQTAVKAEEKGTEFETQIQVATREAMGAEISGVQVVSPEEEQRKEASKEETEVELPKSTSESVDAHQESELDNEIPSNIMQLLVAEQVKPPPDEILDQAFQPSQSQTEERVEELHNKELLFEDVKAKTNVDESQPVVHEGMTVGDDLVLLVPKGKTIEMDIEIALLSEETEENEAVELLESESPRKDLVAHEKAPEFLPRPEDLTEDRPAELEPKTEPEYVPEEVVLPAKASLPAWVGVADAEAEEQKMDEDDEEEEEVFFPLRRGAFAPQEDLSGLRGQEETPGLEIHPDEYEPATDLLEVTQEDVGLKTQQHTEDVGPEVEAQRDIEENTSVTAEELDYEIITKQEAGEAPQPEMERAAVEPQPESADHENDRTATEIKAESEMEKTGLDLSPREEPIEADYDIIDAEEESQARAAAELQGMDWLCLACGCLLSEADCVSGPHQDHKVTSVDRAYGDIKERLSDWISELQRRSENIQDLVSELELTYNSVEDECAEAEEDMRGQNEEMMTLVMEQYNGMSLNMEDEKKVKLEQLYDQIVSFQEIIDSAKVTLETTAREAETDARSPEDIETRLKEALKSATSQELGPKGLLVFEDYAKSNTSNSHLAQRKGIPVPLKPTLQPQEPGSATSTSVTAYWSVNPADVIDCFQVYCMEDPQGAVSEEYRVTVKESYCVLEELEPDRTYRVWVMAVNYSGCSLPSERLAFTTAPSVPVIDTERCTVLWDSATLRWDVADQTPGQSYTLEYCRQCELEGEGLRSISGIRGPEQKVLLQPNENYLFYIKAVNEGGSSEQSEAALVSTKGTRFHLLKTSAHPSLELSEDRTTLHYSPDTHCHPMAAEKQCPSILGELLPARGLYYWEAVVTGSAAYRVGVAYPTSDSNIPLGETSVSWCLHCTPTSSKYRLLHNGVQTDVLVIDAPQRVGVLLDYQRGRLSFYNAQTGQLLGRLAHRFARPCHPALGLAMPGSLALVMAPEVPEFASRS